jgi:hypothetical protein
VDLTAPELTSADTGKYWDADATVPVEKQDKLDRVVVTFNDKIDSNTVSAADFTVEGIAPLAAEMPSKADKTKIYLTLANNLAADAEPVVTLAGTVSDLAGNSKTGGLATAKDEIAPTFTVTIDKTLIKAAEKAIISISADETIAGVPSVRVHNANGTDVSTLSVVVKTSKSWEATFAGSTTFENKNGVVIIGDDADPISNPGSEGKEDPTATGAIVITVDTIDPTITNWDAAGVDISGTDTDDVASTSPYITVTFSEKVTVGKAEFGVKGGTLADVTAAGNLSDDALKWIYPTSDLTVDGDYTISVEFTDTAGNDDDALVNFEVIEKALVAIALSPGMNLISLPSEPADSAINSVITVADVVSVVAYDSQAGAFLSATRDADGKLSGTLTTMDAMHGYWVNSTSFEPIKVELPDPGFAAVPPSIPVTPGWNLVPVVSLTGQTSGTTKADTYFGSTDWVTAYTFTPPSTWTKVLPNTFATVTFGNGYWLYVSETGILVP